MANTFPFAQTMQAARARINRTMLLPMPRATVDELALRLHLSLDTLRRGQGNITHAQAVLEAVIVTAFLVDGGYGSMTRDRLEAALRDLDRVFEQGRETGVWQLEEGLADLVAEIVTAHDRQLRKAPLWAVSDASDRLERFKAGDHRQSAT
jgi:hypothetical protein